MKILPLVNIKQYTESAKKDLPNGTSAPRYLQINKLPDICVPLISFCGEKADFKSQLSSLEDIHCPSCGYKMLSDKKLKELVKESARMKTMPEYAAFLNKNKDYFHPQFQPFVRYIDNFAQKYPEKPFIEIFKMLRSGTPKIMIKKLNNKAEYLSELMKEEKFSDSDKEKINECIGYLKAQKSIPKAFDVKQNLMQTLGSLENPKKWEIYTNVKKGIQNVYGYHIALQYHPEKSGGLSEQAFVLKNMLSYSKNEMANVYTNIKEDKRFNNMLICNDCRPKYTTFKNIESSPNAKQNIQHYIDDIASAIADNKLAGNSSYLYEFIGAVNSVTKHRMSFDRKKVSSGAQVNVFKETKSEYIFADYEGIPCACCGVTTITHEQKLKLFKIIADCENLSELKNVMKLYSKHVNTKNRIIYDRFYQIMKENPDIKEDKLMGSLRALSKQDINKELADVKEKLINYTNKNSKNLNYLEKEFIKDFIYELDNRFSKVPVNEMFCYDDYDDAVSNTLDKIKDPYSKDLIKIAKKNIKKLYVRDCLVKPSTLVINKTGGEAKAMFQNIFKMSVITVDHRKAKDLGGEDDYNNKVGYCKDCNNEKSRTPYVVWVGMHPEINQNLPRHLRAISKIIKDNGLKDMIDYPEKTARTSMRLARGKLNIPTEYNTRG